MGLLERWREHKRLAKLVERQDTRDAFGQSRYQRSIYELQHEHHVHWHAYLFPVDITVDQARVYAKHRTLGPRLKEAFGLVVERVRAGNTVRQSFGERDGKRVVASLAIFCQVDHDFTDLRRQLSVATIVADRIRRQREQENRDSTHGWN